MFSSIRLHFALIGCITTEKMKKNTGIATML